MQLLKKLNGLWAGIGATLAAGMAAAQTAPEGLEIIGAPEPAGIGWQPAATSLAEQIHFLNGMLLYNPTGANSTANLRVALFSFNNGTATDSLVSERFYNNNFFSIYSSLLINDIIVINGTSVATNYNHFIIQKNITLMTDNIY